MKNKLMRPDPKFVIYTVGSQKIKKVVRMAFLSDLHAENYGENQKQLLSMVDALMPHIVLLGGDCYDERFGWEKPEETIRLLAEKYTVLFTTGNHEIATHKLREVRKSAKAAGAIVLAGSGVFPVLNGQKLCICGAEDPLGNEGRHQRQLAQCEMIAEAHDDLFSILLTHRPERVKEYENSPFDLVLTGHAHGGQWRVPGLLNGFLAPDQGFFPKYAGGEYKFGNTTMLCSRGLGRQNTPFPRIFDDPEVVCVELDPEDP